MDLIVCLLCLVSAVDEGSKMNWRQCDVVSFVRLLAFCFFGMLTPTNQVTSELLIFLVNDIFNDTVFLHITIASYGAQRIMD